MPQHILLTECPDSSGLIASITRICHEYQLNILKNSEFVDEENGRFFMRCVFDVDDSNSFDSEKFLSELDEALPKGSSRRLVTQLKKRVLIMVTKEAHCLGDILMKNYIGALDVEVVGVIGNYDKLRGLTEKFEVPFYHISHENMSRVEHEAAIAKQISNDKPDYIVLAKYMRILSDDFVQRFPNQIINIHHSFLPAFVGASPYRQAHKRGVKIIGATAHFVTSDLDEGPIIHQDVVHVDHTYNPLDMAVAGQEVEESVLLKALRYVIREKVFVYGNKTVVFE